MWIFEQLRFDKNTQEFLCVSSWIIDKNSLIVENNNKFEQFKINNYVPETFYEEKVKANHKGERIYIHNFTYICVIVILSTYIKNSK
jgi:hypothetical protein